MMNSTLPLLPDSADARDALVWLRKLTKWIGPGFHPDTAASDYVRADTRQSTFTPDEAKRLDRDIDRARDLLAAHRRDPCSVAIKVQRRLMGLVIT
ncbi:MAG: hypothetical protein ACR2GY_09540 [Phycisphaerales bacterium]